MKASIVSQTRIVVTMAVAFFLVGMACNSKLDAQQVDSANIDSHLVLNSTIASLTPTGQDIIRVHGAWNLKDFSSLVGSYYFSNHFLVSLRSEKTKEHFIWEPLTNKGLKLDQATYLAFSEEGKDFLQSMFIYPQINSNMTMLERFPSFGETFSCHVNFPNYFQVSYENNPSKRFFLIWKSDKILNNSYQLCGPTDKSKVSHQKLVYTSGAVASSILSNDDALIFVLDKGYVIDISSKTSQCEISELGLFVLDESMIDLAFRNGGSLEAVVRDQIVSRIINTAKQTNKIKECDSVLQ